MTTKQSHPRTAYAANTSEPPERKSVDARDVGLSLTISDKTLREFDRIQEEAFKTVQEVQKFSWR